MPPSSSNTTVTNTPKKPRKVLHKEVEAAQAQFEMERERPLQLSAMVTDWDTELTALQEQGVSIRMNNSSIAESY